MYADKETDAMRVAISETDRRREIQVAYNERARDHAGDRQEGHLRHGRVPGDGVATPPTAPARRRDSTATKTPEELEKLVVELEEEMLLAAEDLRFEEAARIRDELKELRADLDAIRA